MRRSSNSHHGKKSSSFSSSSSAKKPLSSIVTNPFESRSNKRTKFEVLGRKVRGADRNVALARSDAEKKRNDTLLQEWKALGKNNRFFDKRFGENNTTIDDETKMLVRFKKERLRQLNAGKRSRKFNLDDDNSNEFTLTHGGQIINENHYTDGSTHQYKDDSDDGDDPFMDTSLHFGGNTGEDTSMPSWRGSAAATLPAWMTNGSTSTNYIRETTGEERRRSHKEIMEEVIAKSKAARADRAKEKADTNELIESLDNQANDIIRLIHQSHKYANSGTHGEKEKDSGDNDTSLPMVRTTKQKETRQGSTATTTISSSSSNKKSEENYDSLLSALARQPRSAAARDRSKTAEELAAEEAERLHELEELRRSRARGETNNDSTDKNKDNDRSSKDGNSKLGGDDLAPTLMEEGGVMLSARQKRAAPSTVSIWDYAKKKDEDDKVDDEDESESDDSDSSSDDSDDDDSDDDDEENDLDDFDDQEYDDAMVYSEEEDGDSHMNDDDVDDDDDIEENEEEEEEIIAPRQTKLSSPVLGPLEEMPYTLPCPTNRKEFHTLIQRYCAPRPPTVPTSTESSSSSSKKRSRDTTDSSSSSSSTFTDTHTSPEAAERVYELIRRLRALYAVTLKATNLTLLKQLYRIFIETLQYIGTHTHLYHHRLPVWYTEPIAHHIFSMNQEGSLRNEISTVWKEIVLKVHERIEKSLMKGITHGMRLPTPPSNYAELVSFSPNNTWLTGSDIVLIRIANGIFPSTDFRHPIVTAYCASICQALVYGPVVSEIDMCASIVAASLTMDFTARGRRYIPEVIQTCYNVLGLYAGKTDELDHKTIDDKLDSSVSGNHSTTMTSSLSSSTSTLPVALPDISPNYRPLQKTFLTNPHWLLQYALTAEIDKSSSSSHGIPFALVTDNYTQCPIDNVQYTRASVAKQGLVAILSLVKSVANLLVPSPLSTDSSSTANGPGPTFSGAKLMDASVAPNGNASKEVRGKAYGLSMNSSGNTFTITNTNIPFPCAPEILDPMINCMAAMLALLPSLQKTIKSKGFTAPSASYLSTLITNTMRELIVTRDTIATLRIPMRLQEQSGPPPSVRMLAPLLEDVNAPFNSNSTAIAAKYPHLDPAVAREKEEIRQLQKAVKKEKRGAVRELRRDREFIVRAVDKAKAKRDSEREVVYKGLITDLQRQQAQMNQVLKKSKGLMEDKTSSAGSDKMPWMGVGRTGKTKADRMARKQASREAQH